MPSRQCSVLPAGAARLAVRLAASFVLLGAAGLAQAATFNFNGGTVAGCTYTSGNQTYTCSALPGVGNNDSWVVAGGYTLFVTSSIKPGYNEPLTLGAGAKLKVTGNLDLSAMNPAGIVTNGAILEASNKVVIGTVTPSLSADIFGAAVTLGGGPAVTYNGNVTSTGPVTLSSKVTLNGSLSGTAIVTGSNVTLNGPITGSTSFQLGSGGNVTGAITAPVVTIDPAQSVIKGAITASTSVTLGSQTQVNGDINAGDFTLSPAQTVVTGNIQATGTVTMGSHDTINGNVTAGALVMQNGGTEINGDVNANTVSVGTTGTINGTVAAASVSMSSGALITKTVYCPPASNGTCACVTNSGGSPPSCAGAAPHHIQVTHPGSGLTCAPTTVLLKACGDATCSTLYTAGNVSVTLSPGGQTFVIGNSGINNAATIQQTTAGKVIIGVTSAPASTVAGTCVNTGTPADGCAYVAADSGLLLSAPSHVAGTMQTLTVSAVRKSDNTLSCAPAFGNNASRTIRFGCAYQNPDSGFVTPTVGGAALPACGKGTANVPLAFNGSVATTTLSYNDVGAMTLNATYVGSGPDNNLVMSGSTQFTTGPATFGFGTIAQIAAPGTINPGAADGAGGKFIAAGEPFTVPVTAYTGSTPAVAARNFGREAVPESIAILVDSVVPPPSDKENIQALLAGSVGTFNNGATTGSNFIYGDAGLLKLKVRLRNANYLDNTALAPPGDVVSGWIGRFVPYRFKTEVITPPMRCPYALAACAATAGLAYSKQPFPADAVKITALNKLDGTTGRYGGAFARDVTLSAWSAAGDTALANPPAVPAGSTLSNGNVTAASFAGGTATAAPTYTFGGTAAVAPTTIYLRAIDGDGVTSQSGGVAPAAADAQEAAITVATGRLNLANNYGSELLPLPVALTAQHWDGTRYATTSTFSATLGAANFTLANCKRLLAADAAGTCKAVVALESGAVKLSQGVGRIRFAAPRAGNTGSVDIALKAGTGIDYLYPGTTARQVFGVYRSPVIYLREVY